MTNSARRMQNIAPFYVMKLLARAKDLEAQGKHIVHMEIGEPDFKTPQPIVDAGIDALKKGLTHYTPALGLPVLREAISTFYRQSYEASVSSNSVVITPGASGALQLICGSLINPGEEVLMTDPGYPCNRHFVQLVEGVPRFINLDESNDYSVSLSDIKSSWNDKTKAILLASPSNPTGRIIDIETLDKIAEFVKSKNGYLILDEIYLGLTYGKKYPSLAGRHSNVFIINSFSKYFSMTGWRLGWMVAPDEFITDIEKLAQNIFLAPTTSSQYAALTAFDPQSISIMESYREAFEERRDYLYTSLNDIGFKIKNKPEGAFYLYANSEKFGDNSFDISNDLLEKVGVAVTPGIDFGAFNAESHLRFAYTVEMSELEEGISRLKKYCH